MKITKSRLKQIIKEEMKSILNEAKGPEWRGPGEEFIGPWAPPRSGHTREVIPGGMDPAYEPDDESGGAGDIDILEAFAEVLDVAGRGSGNLSMELRRLAEIAAKNPEFDVEEPEAGVEALELPEAPSTRSLAHQRSRKFRNP